MNVEFKSIIISVNNSGELSKYLLKNYGINSSFIQNITITPTCTMADNEHIIDDMDNVFWDINDTACGHEECFYSIIMNVKKNGRTHMLIFGDINKAIHFYDIVTQGGWTYEGDGQEELAELVDEYTIL